MKITAGLGSVDDYPMYVEAGADECFCGYVPFAWAEKYGVLNPLNRREVRAYNVQIGSYEELKILGNMRKYYQVPVAITFNSLSYTPEQYPVVGEIIGQCHQAGFDTIIVADPALLLYIRSQKIPCRIHLSGEFGEINSQMADFLEEMEICRVIFHRKNTVEDMKSCISNLKKNIEYPIFLRLTLVFSLSFCDPAAAERQKTVVFPASEHSVSVTGTDNVLSLQKMSALPLPPTGPVFRCRKRCYSPRRSSR